MIALAGAVLTASLLGSTHCAGMCGAFAAFATSPDEKERPVSRAALNAAYNAGRLATYLLLGLTAGAVGAAFELGGAMMGVQRIASLTAAGLMIGIGVIALMRHAGVRIGRAPLPAVLMKMAHAGHVRAFSLPPAPRAFAIGLLTTFLPCGWLYTFVLTSAGTASPALGALLMAVFWIGTLPAMVAIGVGAQYLTGSMRRHLPLATNLLLIGVGMWMVLARISAPVVPGHLVAVDWRDPAADIRSRTASDGCPLCNDAETPKGAP
ncbi:MAG: sulfite exporter TauE/SafE family protein [Phycisphaeraceae bacterium]|nr:sulfite exporter TauE/SafE family protein [Phycisphaeraceae bacterium]